MLAHSTNDARVIAGAAAAHDSWYAKQRRALPHARTFADGLATRAAYEMTFPALLEGLEDFVTVTDAEIATALRVLLSTTHTMVEGAGAAGLAAILTNPERFAGKHVGTPSGLVTTARYDAHGNIDTVIVVAPYGAAQGDAVTTYGWDTKWDFVTKVKPPMGDSITMAYHVTTGNRLWQRNARGDTTKFLYLTSGQIWGIDSPLLPPDSIAYDTQLGNVIKAYTPARRLTSFTPDGLGRVARTTSPIDASHNVIRGIGFDALGRVIADTTIGPAMPTTAAESVFVRTYFNKAGLTDSIARWSGPDTNQIGKLVTAWRYDSAGRTTQEIAGDSAVDEYQYDDAGNLISHETRRGYTLAMHYDALNRRTSRSVPQVTYPYSGGYPRYTNGGSLVIQADVETFAYDDLGNLTQANNNDAKITRAYYPGGALAADTLRIRTWATLAQGGNFTLHAYGLGYVYDLNGRRTKLAQPQSIRPQLLGGPFDTLPYAYTNTGALSGVGVNGLFYDADGRLDSLRYGNPGRAFEGLHYDDAADGVLRRRLVEQYHATSARYGGTATTLIFDDTLTCDHRGKVRGAYTYVDSTRMEYSGLGTLERMIREPWNGFSGSTHEEYFVTDGLGSTRSRPDRAGPDEVFRYAPRTGRQTSSKAGSSARDTTIYDAAGNRHILSRAQWEQGSSGWDLYGSYARYYYGADEKLRVVDRRTNQDNIASSAPPESKGAYENYRYDALGRRILMRSRRDSTCGIPCLSVIERTVWDGAQLLYEIRYPGGDTVTIAMLEQDTGAIGKERPWTNSEPEDDEWELDTIFSHHYGRVAYIHGPGIDQPLSLVRMDYGDTNVVFTPFTVTLHNNWRGHIADATINGNVVSSHCKKTVHWNANHPPTYDTTWVCVQADWAAPYSATLRTKKPMNPVSWFGSLVKSKTDGSGQMYMRNRYYDPTSGRFTQEDPIGLAGGMNLYGFAAGDPINHSDPFGLCPPEDENTADCEKKSAASDTARTTAERVGDFAAGFGDFITFGGTKKIREMWDCEGCVDYSSGVYTAGQVTGGVVGLAEGGLAVARVGFGVTSRVAIHGAHHTFPLVGRAAHVQVNVWKIGVKGSGRAPFRILLPWR